MVRRPTQEQIDAWLRERELAKVSIACKLVVRDTEGNVLLVKPHHKHAWQFPGGAMEVGEDPKVSLLREIKEEINVDINARDVRLLDTTLPFRPQVLLLMYDYTKRLPHNTAITFQESELYGYEFVHANDVMKHVEPYYEVFWRQYLHNNYA